MDSIAVLLPVLIPFSAAAVGLAVRKIERLQAAWSVGAMGVALASSCWLAWGVFHASTPWIYRLGGWPTPFGILLVADRLSAFLVVMSQFVLFCGMLYALTCRDKCVRYPTFYPLFLCLATGLTGAFLTGDLFNLFVFTELMVISGAILTSISDDRYGVEASYKYFYISTLAGIFMLIACGSLYASYGTLNMADLAGRLSTGSPAPLARTALAFLFAAFCIKSAVLPFHFWQPDFHTAAPTPVHAVLSSVVVKLGVYGFLRMTSLLFIPEADFVRTLLLALSLGGVFLGALGATGTYDAKRMLAYSTMGQIGFILIGIAWGTPAALAASLVYTFNHSLVKAAMLMLAGAVASRAPVKTARFQVIQGVGRSFPSIGLLFFLGGMSLAGLPPTNGFLSKLFLFQSGLQGKEYASIILLALGSLISLVYVFRAFQIIWFRPLAEGAAVKTKGDRLLAPAVLVVACLLLGIWGGPLIQAAEQVVRSISDPSVYIGAIIGR